MCDKRAFRSGQEDISKPRTAEELLALRNRQQALRDKEYQKNGKDWVW